MGLIVNAERCAIVFLYFCFFFFSAAFWDGPVKVFYPYISSLVTQEACQQYWTYWHDIPGAFIASAIDINSNGRFK